MGPLFVQAVCRGLLLVTMTLPYLLLKGFFRNKVLSEGDMFVCRLFFPKIFTKGVCWWHVYMWVFFPNPFTKGCAILIERPNTRTYLKRTPSSHAKFKCVRAQWATLLIMEDVGGSLIFAKVINTDIIKVATKLACGTHPIK